MKEREIKLNRLFAVARMTPPVEDDGFMSPHLQTRILARWRRSVTDADAGPLLAAMFRRALMCAAVIMLASIAWSLSTREPENDLAIANYELREDVMP